MSKAQLQKWISDFPEGVFTTGGKIVYCQACSKQLKQHSQTAKHQKNEDEFQRRNNRQPLLADAMGKSAGDSFSLELCNALIGASILLFKLKNRSFRGFLEKYCQRDVPHHSTLAKIYLKISYQQVINRIKAEIGTSYIWASVDETTDIMGRYVANFIMGKLDSRAPSRTYLISVKMLEQTNHPTIARFVNDGLRGLLAGEKENRLLIFVTDAAKYMKKAADVLSALLAYKLAYIQSQFAMIPVAITKLETSGMALT